MDMREPPLEPPLSEADKLGIEDWEIDDRAAELAWKEYPPSETDYLDDWINKFYPDGESRRFFYIDALATMLQLDKVDERKHDSTSEYNFPITPNFMIWRDLRAKRYFTDEKDIHQELEAYAATFGFVEVYWDEIVVSPDEEKAYEVFDELFWPSLAKLMEDYHDHNSNDSVFAHFSDYADIVLKKESQLYQKAEEQLIDETKYDRACGDLD